MTGFIPGYIIGGTVFILIFSIIAGSVLLFYFITVAVIHPVCSTPCIRRLVVATCIRAKNFLRKSVYILGYVLCLITCLAILAIFYALKWFVRSFIALFSEDRLEHHYGTARNPKISKEQLEAEETKAKAAEKSKWQAEEDAKRKAWFEEQARVHACLQPLPKPPRKVYAKSNKPIYSPLPADWHLPVFICPPNPGRPAHLQEALDRLDEVLPSSAPQAPPPLTPPSAAPPAVAPPPPAPTSSAPPSALLVSHILPPRLPLPLGLVTLPLPPPPPPPPAVPLLPTALAFQPLSPPPTFWPQCLQVIHDECGKHTHFIKAAGRAKPGPKPRMKIGRAHV